MNTIDTLKVKEKLIELRKKWLKYKKLEDEVMMKVTEKQAKALKIGYGLE